MHSLFFSGHGIYTILNFWPPLFEYPNVLLFFSSILCFRCRGLVLVFLIPISATGPSLSLQLPWQAHDDLNSWVPLKCPNKCVLILNVNNPFISLGNQIKTRTKAKMHQSHYLVVLLALIKIAYKMLLKSWISQREANVMKNISSNNTE